MFQTTRRQLAIWYTTVTAILLLVFATGVYIYVRGTLVERIDDTLNHVVEVVQRSLVIEPAAPKARILQVNLEASFRDNFLVEEDDHIDLEWFSPTGQLLWFTFDSAIAVPLHTYSNGETVHLDAEHLLRQVTHRVELGRQVLGYLRVSHPWFEVTKPSRELVLDLFLGTSLMVMIVAGVGWLLSGLAMQPIRDSYQRLKQFTADASHELRNPIAIIQTNVQVALSDPDLEPQAQRDHLQVIERLTRRLGKLVDDLLFLARQDSSVVPPQWQIVNLAEILENVLEEQHMAAQAKGIHLTCLHCSSNISSEIVQLEAEADQLSRLFTNLISNAIQFTPVNGEIEVDLQRTKRSGQPSLQVKVSDNGIGIPEVALPKLFDRFYRVDPARSQASGGTGLGLAIARAIVDRHQGQIQIESHVESLGQTNQGTIVTVMLPTSHAPSS
ncbi:MAG: HAMP domain-containing sensor histidine kinase [Synechococcales bacterium]|nr:HAMP domain-containing sensor histidine kinase [Synechococcales bacterium]